MKIVKIISGGQTGADIGGLIIAKELGIITGGYAPKGFKTENGSDFKLRDEYNLTELNISGYGGYSERTKLNIRESDITIIFANKNSPGSKLTLDECIKTKKKWIVLRNTENTNDCVDILVKELPLLAKNLNKTDLIVNIAGNRESVSPGIQKEVYQILKEFIYKFNANS